MGWRTTTEAARQKLGLIERQFKPTSNSRNEAMFRDATAFARQLKSLERQLTVWQRTVEGGYETLIKILKAPLPRIYEEGHSGPVPAEEQLRLIGQDVQIDKIQQSSQEMGQRLEQEILDPVDQWLSAFEDIQMQMKDLESLRLEVDSRRRTTDTLQGKIERLRASTSMQRDKQSLELEYALQKMQHKQQKLQHASDQYRELEQRMYNSLFTLIRDTSVLRDYTAASLLIIQDCFLSAHGAFRVNPMGYSLATSGFTAVEVRYAQPSDQVKLDFIH